MCIICVSKSGVQQPTDSTIRAMFRRNPHGAGYMYARNGKVTIHKGFMNIEDFLSAVHTERFTPQDSVVYHFRISTQAGVNAAMTHTHGHDGLRIEKVLEHSWYPETTKYTYHGKLLTHMTVDYTDWDEVALQDKLHFFYDAQSRPAKVNFNGTIYTYISDKT